MLVAIAGITAVAQVIDMQDPYNRMMAELCLSAFPDDPQESMRCLFSI